MPRTAGSSEVSPMKRALIAFSLLLTCTPLARGAGMLVADGGLGGQMEIVSHQVTVTIDNGIAATEVEQTFRNAEDRVVEALYVCPIPKGASVAGFSMWIQGKEVVGEVVEKEKARQIYESYKQVRKDPGLLEQRDHKTFEMRIFPIAPRAEQRVRVTYYQELDVDDSWATYVYPLATSPLEGAPATRTGRMGLSLQARSEVPIVEMESPSHGSELVVVPHGESQYEASLEANGAELARDVVVAFRTSRPRTGLDVVTSRPWEGEDGYFLLTLTAGEELEGATSGMDYVFVLDVSGSMKEEGKLDTSRGSIAEFVASLGTDDRFELMAFNVAPRTLFGELRAVDDAAKQAARGFLDGQDAKGGTELRPALSAAYRYASEGRTLNVVILSDGLTDQAGVDELMALIRSRPNGVRAFCVGVGNDVNRRMLEQIAEESGGLAAFLSQEDSFTRQAAAFRRKLTKPAATDLSVTFEGGEVYDLEPTKLPSLYHGMPLRLYGRYRGTGPSRVHVAGNVEGKRFGQSVEIAFDGRTGNPLIERMWAWHRVDRLLKDGGAGSRGEVVRLGEGYSIVTEHTSFLVLENDQEYKRWSLERRNALRTERDRGHLDALRRSLEGLRDAKLAGLGPGDPGAAPALAPDIAPGLAPATMDPVVRPGVTTSRRRGDIDLPRLGGGAMDPFTAGLAALAALSLGRRLRARVS